MKSYILHFLYEYVYKPIVLFIIYLREYREFRRIYGSFHHLSKDVLNESILRFPKDKSNVSGFLSGEIVWIIKNIIPKPKIILLDGENSNIIGLFKKSLHLEKSRVQTTGIGGTFDYLWDFEKNPPTRLKNEFDLIVSQAMLEHLVNPYKHLSDLVSKLKPNGTLIVHSVMPGFPYHRHPIDAVRFYPDFFEKSAMNLGISITSKYIRDFHIFYALKK